MHIRVIKANGIADTGSKNFVTALAENARYGRRVCNADGQQFGGSCGSTRNCTGCAHPVSLGQYNTVYACGIERSEHISEIVRILNSVQKNIKTVLTDKGGIQYGIRALGTFGDDAAVCGTGCFFCQSQYYL